MPRSSPKGEGVPPEAVLQQLRVPLIRAATLAIAGREERVMLIDVGLAGVFVERAGRLPEGAELRIAFTLPGNASELRARCRAAWYHPAHRALPSKQLPEGSGLEFVEVAEADRRRLREHVIAHCRKAGKARRFHPSWPRDGER
ncbi:MAG: PilZ domain-containing protein [Vicinamibacteria bacterium]